MKNSYIALALAALALTATPVFADAIGTTVTGSINFNGGSTNYFDPANGFVPAGYGNSSSDSVVIGTGVEFGFSDGANTDTANFDDTTLTITDVTASSASAFQMTFVDSIFSLITSDDLSIASNSFGAGFSYVLNGDTLTVNLPELDSTGTRSVMIAYDGTPTTPTPEPSTFVFLGTGLVGAVGAMRRKLSA